jgi:hypothetical protein
MAGMDARRVPLLVLLAAAVWFAACGNRDSDPDVIGPVLVYRVDTIVGDRVKAEIVRYDAGARREIERYEAPAVQTVGRSGAVFLVNSGETEDSIERLTSDSDRDTLFRSARRILPQIAPSPDGSSVAFTEIDRGEARDAPMDVRVLDVSSGNARTLATFIDHLHGEFRGLPSPRVWRDDGRGFVVTGNTRSGAPGSIATVYLDGRVVDHGRSFAILAPNGRAYADPGYNGVGCVLQAPQVLRLFDMDANREAVTLGDQERGLVFREWAPDSSGVLYAKFRPAAGGDDTCLPALDSASGVSFLLSMQGGTPDQIADVGALRRSWYADRTLEWTCSEGGQTPFGSCERGEPVLLLNGVEVARGTIYVQGFEDQ